MTYQELLEGFFRQQDIEACVTYLAPHLSGSHQESLVQDLMKIIKGKYPKRQMHAEKTHNALKDNPNSLDPGKDAVLSSILSCWQQRYAAVRLLEPFVTRPKVFRFLWEVTLHKYSDGLGGLDEEALQVLATTLPQKARYFLTQYSNPYRMRKVEGLSKKLSDITPQAAAATVLLCGYTRCDAALQARIRGAVSFTVYVPDDKKRQEKYAQDMSAFWVRRKIIKLLCSMYWSDRQSFDASSFKPMFEQNFFDKFLEVFRDDGGIYSEEIVLALEWSREPRVIDAFCDFLERWGGTFLSTDATEIIIHALAQCPESLVTERLVRALDQIYHSPMETTRGVGPWSAKKVRDAIDEWRKAKLIS